MREPEVIPARVRSRKGVAQILPVRPLHLRPGDRAEHVKRFGRHTIVVYRAGFWKRLWLKVRGES